MPHDELRSFRQEKRGRREVLRGQKDAEDEVNARYQFTHAGDFSDPKVREYAKEDPVGAAITITMRGTGLTDRFVDTVDEKTRQHSYNVEQKRRQEDSPLNRLGKKK